MRTYPYPEAIARPDDDASKLWRIIPGENACVSLSERRMVVPLGIGPCSDCGFDHSRSCRIHELAHVSFTPSDAFTLADAAGVSRDSMLAAEDMRDNIIRDLWLRHPRKAPALCPDVVARMAREMMDAERYGTVLRWLASAVCAEYQYAAPVIAEYEAGADILRIVDDASAACYAYRRPAETGQWYIGQWYRPDWQEPPSILQAIEAARILDHYAEMLEGKRSENAEDAEDAEDGEPAEPGRNIPDDSEGSEGSGLWGRMEIDTAPLTLPARPGLRIDRPTEEGPVPSHIERWMTDRRVFTRRKRHRGGTLVVDCSGSMEWNPKDLRAVLDECPAATVALYSGHDGGNGRLRIVAENGRKAADEWIAPPMGGGNAVDGPAIRWMRGKPGPHVWMSDGGVTGLGPTDALIRDTERAMAETATMQVPDAKTAFDVLAGRLAFRRTVILDR